VLYRPILRQDTHFFPKRLWSSILLYLNSGAPPCCRGHSKDGQSSFQPQSDHTQLFCPLPLAWKGQGQLVPRSVLSTWVLATVPAHLWQQQQQQQKKQWGAASGIHSGMWMPKMYSECAGAGQSLGAWCPHWEPGMSFPVRRVSSNRSQGTQAQLFSPAFPSLLPGLVCSIRAGGLIS
jgi:hypothetical protein